MQGLGKVDNWRVKTENTQKRRTTGGQGPGKAEHWWAGPGKADRWARSLGLKVDQLPSKKS